MKLRALLMCGISLLMLFVLAGCKRPASIRPAALPVTTSQTPAENPAQVLISATQTASALAASAPDTAPEEPAPPVSVVISITPVDIVATVTPNIPAPTLNAIIIPTLLRPVTYTIQDGEDPWCIARRFNVDIGELLSINRLTTDSQLEPGSVIRIPDTGHPWSSGQRALQPHPAQYTVRMGDTLSGIACLFGDVSPEAIIAINQLTQPAAPQGGQVIMIP